MSNYWEEVSFSNLRFSNCPVNGAAIFIDSKEVRWNYPNGNPPLTESLAVSLHIYDSMIDVIEGDFIRVGNQGAARIRIYNCQFFDIAHSVVDNVAKSIANPVIPNSLFEFRNCNFEGCGGIHYPNPEPFLYAGDSEADYFFSNCIFTTQTIEPGRFSGGVIKVDAARTIDISNCEFRYNLAEDSLNAYFLHVYGKVAKLKINYNRIFKRNSSAYAVMQFYSGFQCDHFDVSDNLFIADQGVCIYIDNPSTPVSNGKLCNNQFGPITSAAGGNAIVGNLNPGIVVANNIFTSPQDLKLIAQANYGMKGATVTHQAAVPTSGQHYKGDRVINTNPSTDVDPSSWICIADGTSTSDWIPDYILSDTLRVKAYAYFVWTGTAFTIFKPYNIASITRVAVGTYDINFSNDIGGMPIVSLSMYDTNASPPWGILGAFDAPGSNSLRINIFDFPAGVKVDNSFCLTVH